MALQLNQIIPWGRSLKEYERMFRLTPDDLSGSMLDCGGGPASFTAEMAADGFHAHSVDPIYLYSGADIRHRFEAIAGSIIEQVRATPDDWTWSYHRDPANLLANRQAALETFLTDYDAGLHEGRYIVGELPALPFAAGSFSLAVCSHLLFLYSDLLSAEFHLRSVRELCRVAREVRIFPLVTLGRQPSPHLETVRSALTADGWTTEIVSVDYELQRGGNQMLRIFQA